MDKNYKRGGIHMKELNYDELCEIDGGKILPDPATIERAVQGVKKAAKYVGSAIAGGAIYDGAKKIGDKIIDTESEPRCPSNVMDGPHFG